MAGILEDVADTEKGFAELARKGDADQPLDPSIYHGMMDELRASFNSGKTKSLEWRRAQLRAFMLMCQENHEEITAAVRADHGGFKMRGVMELVMFKEAEQALKNLDTWAAPEVVSNNMPMGVPLGKALIRKEPKGILLNIAPWNYPISLALQPAVSAIAAGNCVVIKPSEISENSAALIKKLVEKYMDNSCIKVVLGAHLETGALLEQKFDHIMYTGNGAVARIVMTAAAKHLTPVTLELGGKSPVYVDKSAAIDTAVARISFGKWLNVGQTCVAPDYILVSRYTVVAL
jgi:aldehyde dehydrogenase (NAD+)